MEADEIRASLAAFTGTTSYYRHWTNLVRLTEGVHYLVETAKCHWLVDAIALAQPRALPDSWLREIQFWELFVRPDRSATLVCSRDSEDVAFRRHIPFTDFPMDYVRLYVEGGVILLPSEH